MKMSKVHPRAGYSLLEMLITLTILAVVVGVVMEGLIKLQKRSAADNARVDSTQEARQFMDQITNDIHQSGFPNSRMFDPANPVSASSYAGGSANGSASTNTNGLVAVSSTAVQFEGDVDGSGIVSEVYLSLQIPNSGSCPCTLQRGVLPKSAVGTGQVPYYTELDNVMNTNIFTAYFYNGTAVTLPAASSDLPNIMTIKMEVNLRARQAEMDGTYPTITMTSEAMIGNY